MVRLELMRLLKQISLVIENNGHAIGTQPITLGAHYDEIILSTLRVFKKTCKYCTYS